MPASPAHSATRFCRTLLFALIASVGVLASGVARGADESEDSPDLAAYYRSASNERIARIAPAVHGSAAVGSGAARPASANSPAPENGYTSRRDIGTETVAGSGVHPGSAGSEDGAVVWERWSDGGGLFSQHRSEPAGSGWFTDQAAAGAACQCGDCSGYHWEFLPKENLYPFYLADTKASRLAGQWIEATDDGTLLDGTLGGRFGVFRYVDATPGPFRRGIQADIEGSAQVRLDMDSEQDVRAVDFRAGVPIAMSFGRFQTRFGYYHLSSHVGDEFLIRNPTFDRQNYSRDVLFLGAAYWLSESMRAYGEAGWAFYSDVCEPWEFVFGVEDAPRHPTGLRGAPFYAVNGRLREEVDFGGSLTVQAGWAWQSGYDTGLLRTGLHYFNGKSNQFSFYDDHEELIGAGLWYDF